MEWYYILAIASAALLVLGAVMFAVIYSLSSSIDDKKAAVDTGAETEPLIIAEEGTIASTTPSVAGVKLSKKDRSESKLERKERKDKKKSKDLEESLSNV